MSIVGNSCSEVGDVLIINSLLSINASYFKVTSYTDLTLNETSTKFFTKQFRVSQDGLIFTNWEELNLFNISQIEGNVLNNSVYFQFRYERTGSDVSGTLDFVSISINGSVIQSFCSSEVTDLSIFKGLSCGNFVTAQLCSNLLEKLYKKGIIPEYMIRGEGSNEDEDYISFWSAISCYFSMFITYLSKFDTVYMQRDLLLEFLIQKGIYVCEDTQTLNELQYISKNFPDEIRKRGTIEVFKRKSNFEFILDIDFSGVNLSNNFIDISKNAIQSNGAAQISTSQFNSFPSSGLFNGLTDFLIIDYNSSFDLSEKDFFIQASFNSSSFSLPQCIISCTTSSVDYDWSIILDSNSSISFVTNSGSDFITASVLTMNTGEWYTVKFEKKNGISKIYLNKKEVKSKIINVTNDSKVKISIGCESWNLPTKFFNGYIDDIRIKNLGYDYNFIDGELIRLTCTENCDEFLFTISDVNKRGWNIGSSSPMYKGTLQDTQLNKAYEDTKDFVDLLKYRQINPQNQSIVSDGTKKSMYLFPFPGTGDEVGIGAIKPTTDISKSIVVNPNIDYEITFWIKQLDISASSITFGCDAFDCFYNSYNLTNITGSFSQPNRFFVQEKMISNDRYFFVRGIIYSLNHALITGDDSKLNIGIGNNLQFTNANTNLIVPYLTVKDEKGVSDATLIWDFKVRPLKKDFSLCFLNTANILQIWALNNNKKKSITEIQEITRKYLIPYNTILIYKWLNI